MKTLTELSPTIYWLRVRNTALPHLKTDLLTSLGVKHLNIIRSNISVIDENVFPNADGTLESLDLSTNSITEVNINDHIFFHPINCSISIKNTFQNWSVSDKDRKETLLLQIPSASLRDLSRLNFLNLNYNRLWEIRSMAFAGLFELSRLSLYDNSIEHIEDQAFAGLNRYVMPYHPHY